MSESAISAFRAFPTAPRSLHVFSSVVTLASIDNSHYMALLKSLKRLLKRRTQSMQ